jgi:5-methylcytosine-specific restriction endonuclease McrA
MCTTLLPPEYEIDHKIPLVQGGSNEESNLQALCPNCHRRKTMHEQDIFITQHTKKMKTYKQFKFLEYNEYVSRPDKPFA